MNTEEIIRNLIKTDLDGIIKFFQDLKNQSLAPKRFVQRGILDTKTNLEWHLNTNHGRMPWQDAMDYCQSLGDGWRLPTIEEFKELIEGMKLPSEELNKQGFQNVTPVRYWSSSIYADGTSSAWGVGMYGGYADSYYRSDSYYVWPVRSKK